MEYNTEVSVGQENSEVWNVETATHSSYLMMITTIATATTTVTAIVIAIAIDGPVKAKQLTILHDCCGGGKRVK